MLSVINPVLVQMITSLGGDVKPLALSPSFLHINWKGMKKIHDNVKKRVGDVSV